jgi:hypothetical protein
LLGIGLYIGLINKGDTQMINKATGIRIASTFSSKNVPLPLGYRPTEWTRKHGLPASKQPNAGMELAKDMRARLFAK